MGGARTLLVQTDKRDEGPIAEFRAKIIRDRAQVLDEERKERAAEKRSQRDAEEQDRRARRAERERAHAEQQAARRAAEEVERERLRQLEVEEREERDGIARDRAAEKKQLVDRLRVESNSISSARRTGCATMIQTTSSAFRSTRTRSSTMSRAGAGRT